MNAFDCNLTWALNVSEKYCKNISNESFQEEKKFSYQESDESIIAKCKAKQLNNYLRCNKENLSREDEEEINKAIKVLNESTEVLSLRS